jgi:hypothetical protein
MTMLVVAIAVLSAKAFAMAPTIGYVPSPVIADDTPVTGSRIFVYPDAMDLGTLATDDTVSTSAIIWSYYAADRYQINGLDSMDLATDDPNSPGGKSISATDSDPASVDSNPMTITFRDMTLSPISAGDVNQNQTPTSPTIVGSGVVTLFASDGSTYSMKSIMVYTQQDGYDHLSGGYGMTTVMDSVPSNTNWTTYTDSGLGSAPTYSSSSSSGLCLGAPLTPDTYGGWESPYGYVDLIQNQVYRFRLSMTGEAVPAGTTPLWDFQVDNFDVNHQGSTNKYGLGYLVFDNEGGAEAVGVSSQYDVWFTPVASLASSWNDATTGMFTSTMDSLNDMRLQFRLLDIAVPANNASLDAGTLCLRNLEVSHVAMTDMPVEGNVINDTNLTSANYSVNQLAAPGHTNVSYSGGNIVLSPNTATYGDAAWDNEIIEIKPGDTNLDLTNGTTIPDNFPIAWPATPELLRGEVSISANDAAAVSNPPDGIALVFDPPTTEFTDTNWINGGPNLIGMPALTPTNYVCYFYTQKQSLTTIPNGKSLRLGASILLTQNINAGGSAHNTGGVTINSFKVDKMALPSN